MTDDQIVDGILAAEGGFVDDPSDRGGATHHGITIATLSRWIGRDATVQDVRDLPIATARAIYQHLYLAPFAGLDADVKPQVVDIAVTSGVLKARQLLALAQQQTARPVGVQLVIERLRYVARIVRTDPSQAKWILGWINRAVLFLETP